VKKKEVLITDFFGRPCGKYHQEDDDTVVSDFFGIEEGKSNEKTGTSTFVGKKLSSDEIPAVFIPETRKVTSPQRRNIEEVEKKYHTFKDRFEKQEVPKSSEQRGGLMSNEEMVEYQTRERERREAECQHQQDRRKLEKMREELDELKRRRYV